uniref:Uncharacterized protein n=1 Tax=uncultured prokaryote TaxID=198431 RepID=A0A0H5Q3W4_9ZZZZ|nr:hypothetical protein [uncultured prokaryote]
MNPVSLSASTLTWTTLPALCIAIGFAVGVHGVWTWIERRYFPVAEQV